MLVSEQSLIVMRVMEFGGLVRKKEKDWKKCLTNRECSAILSI